MDRRRSGARSPQKFRPQKRQVDDLLNPDVLDDETRRMLMEDVMKPANRPRGDVDTEKPRQQDVAVGVDGRVQSRASASPSAAKAKADKDGRYPAQLRSRVQSGSDELVTAMAARLGDLEKRQKHYTSEIEEMRTKYMHLNDAYQKEVKRRDDAEKLVVDLYDEKKELEDELAEVKQFLEDYGLSWHGPMTPQRQRRKKDDNSTGARSGGGSRSPSQAQSEGGAFDLYAGNFKSPGKDESLQTNVPGGVAGGSSPPLSRHNSGPVHFANTAKKGTQLFSPPSPEKAKGQETKAPAALHGNGTVDVALLIKNARILSDYVGWKAIVKVGERGAAIRDRDVVRVVVYENGICVNSGAFRPYGWALCDAFITDLAEGYYPYEFKDKYPDGFPIEVTDRSTEKLDVRGQSPQRGGPGHRLGGASDGATAGAGAGGGKPSLQQLREGGYQPLSVDEFLKKVPAKTVTANGKLINVRDGVSELMGHKDTEKSTGAGQGQSSGVPLGTVRHVTAVEARYREQEGRERKVAPAPSHDDGGGAREDAGAAAGGESPMVLGDLVALLVRLPDGKKVKLNMSRTSTMYEVRKEFIAAAPEFARQSYELCQAYPAKTFSDHHLTLAELGITRTCTLMIRVAK